MAPGLLRPRPVRTLAQHPCMVVYRLPAEDAAVGVARLRVREFLRWWCAEDSTDDVTLVVSELFTNAIRHSGSEWVEVGLWYAGELMYVEVTDEGRHSCENAAPREADFDDECGRGLMLVEYLSRSWGVRPARAGGGHAVWAAFSPGHALPRVSFG